VHCVVWPMPGYCAILVLLDLGLLSLRGCCVGDELRREAREWLSSYVAGAGGGRDTGFEGLVGR